jgi:hypothetical protein
MVAVTSRRHYNNTSPEARLNIGINAAVTTFAFETGGGTGMPATPFTLTLDYGAASGEEIILVNTLAGDSVTSCTRGYDGTAATSHSAHALCVHTFVAKDADDANDHTSATIAHGTAGAVVGTTDAQTLTNKTVSSSKALATATDPAWKTQAAGSGTAAQIQSRNSGDTVTVFTVDQLGRVIGGAGSFAALVITDKALIAKAFSAGQTASLFEAQNSSGTGLLVVDAKGRLRIVPTDNAVSPVVVVPPTGAPFALQVRDSADTVDQLTFDTAGQLVGATSYLRGFFAADVIRYPTDGSKFKVDTNGAVTMAGAVTAAGAVTGSNMNWTSYVPGWFGTVTNPVIGNGSATGGYVQLGKIVHCWGKIVAGTTTTYGSGGYSFGLPVAADAAFAGRLGHGYLRDTGTSDWIGTAGIGSSTSVFILNGLGGAGTNTTHSPAQPFAMGNTDSITWQLTYPAA